MANIVMDLLTHFIHEREELVWESQDENLSPQKRGARKRQIKRYDQAIKQFFPEHYTVEAIISAFYDYACQSES